MSWLRAGVLGGLTVGVAGTGPCGDAIAARVQQLGAAVASPADAATATGRWAVVFDATTAFAQGGRAGLAAVLDESWQAVLPVAEALSGGDDRLHYVARPGKILLVAPAPDRGALASAARSALENLARTLSVEWARHRVTTCAIWPGGATADETVAELAAYLLSPAGDYLSGCRLELDAVTVGDELSPRRERHAAPAPPARGERTAAGAGGAG